jgi:hypothetical protein
MHRELKNSDVSLCKMQEDWTRELRGIREAQDSCDKKAQRALAAILEVSVEFADVRRRLEVTEFVLSDLVTRQKQSEAAISGVDVIAMPPQEAVACLAVRWHLTEEMARLLFCRIQASNDQPSQA